MATKRRPAAPKLLIEVTREIIDRGVQSDSGYCMISEAVRAAFPDASRIATDIQTIRFSDQKRGLRYIFLTPRVGQLALYDFDEGIVPEPFSFVLRGGHVTAMRASSLRRTRKTTEASRKASKEAIQKARATAGLDVPKRKTIVDRDPKRGKAPELVGGQPPPVAPLSRRREFGLRGWSRSVAQRRENTKEQSA